MTNVEYNDVLLQDVLTRGIEYDNEQDSTRVDPLFTRARVTCTAIVHTNPQYTLGAAGGSDIASSLANLTQRLLVPRKRFRMTVGGVTIFDVRPATAGANLPLHSTDVNNGPKPSFKVLMLIGETSARVEFSVELAIPNCSKPGQGYLNFRFWIADDIDANWYTTRLYRGRLRVTSKNYSPHWFRNVVMPPLLPTFRRETINFHESDDGLELDFEIRDVEEYAMPPFPATTWRGNHMVVSPRKGGMTVESEVRVEVTGPNSVHKSALALLAGRIIDKKLHWFARAKKKSLLQLYMAFNTELAENRVEAIARCQFFGDDRKNAFNVLDGDLVTDLPTDVNPPFGYTPHIATPPVPTASLAGVFLSALNDACKPASMPQSATKIGDQAQTNAGQGPKVNRVVGQLPAAENKYSQQHGQAAYTLYKARSSLIVDTGQVGMPIAGRAKPLAPKAARVAVIQLHNGFAKRIVEIEAERIGEWPELPEPVPFTDSNSIEHTPTRYEISPAMPVLAADGLTDVFRSGMRIEYLLDRPPGVGESIPVGNLPYRTPGTGAAATTVMPFSAFRPPKSILASGQ
jgi:hypothetical protein